MNSRVPALTLGVLGVAALVLTVATPARAQDDPQAEIAALKQVVAEQGRQIEVLSAQVAQLLSRLEGKPSVALPTPEPANLPPGEPAAPTPAPGPSLVATPLAMPPEPNFHVVEKGDSLEKIAKSCGTTTAELQKLNNMSDPNKLRIGQKIILPAGAAPKAE
jgi:2',3'-cyclic-nucleotide 2'-phosphodiesterase/3'-nucleotidase